MDDTEIKMLRELITSRLMKSQERLKSREDYAERLNQQRETEAAVKALFMQKLEKDERIFVDNHYVGETDLIDFETKEAYIQGLHDGIKALGLLGIFNVEVWAW